MQVSRLDSRVYIPLSESPRTCISGPPDGYARAKASGMPLVVSLHVSAMPLAAQQTGAKAGDWFGPDPVLQTQFEGLSERQSTSTRTS
jgi:hypothetical protein